MKRKEMKKKMSSKTCMCEINDPCDYHAATCIICPRGQCVGHPDVAVNSQLKENQHENR